MKILVIIPDRGDRPEFMDNCLRMIDNQTGLNGIKVDKFIVNEPPKNKECDITYRYRTAYEACLSGYHYDAILFMENDDYYAPNYIESMLTGWIANNEPDIFGTNFTYYYHLGILKFRKLEHFKRSSMMNTLIKPGLKIVWPNDTEPFTDMHLWKQLKGITFAPNGIISMGMKHDIGKTGGSYHNNRLESYNQSDPEMNWLKSTIDPISFEFYFKINSQIKHRFA